MGEKDAKEKAAKEKAAKKKEASNKERSDKEKVSKEKLEKEKAREEKKNKAIEKDQKRRAAGTCTVTAYEHNSYRGRVEQRHSICHRGRYDIRYGTYGRRRGFQASSFKLSSGCQQVQLWDEDACRYGYGDNVNI